MKLIQYYKLILKSNKQYEYDGNPIIYMNLKIITCTIQLEQIY